MTLCETLLLLIGFTSLAEVGVGESGAFLVDTRWKDFEGAGVSAYFRLDTRYSGSTGEAVSDLFAVDTLGATTGTATMAGRVTDDHGAGLGGATVSALFNSVVRAQAGSDGDGYYTLASLPAGTYSVRATKANYQSGVAYGVTVANGQTVARNFSLPGAPPTPMVEDTTRPLEQLNLVPITSPQLKVFVDGEFVANGSINPAKPTVVMTHGWNSQPEAWAVNMAAKLIAGGVHEANLLAWDWHGRANTGAELGLALSRTPNEGEKLGQALAVALAGQTTTPVHFIGHSLGTLVNACAADYLLHKASPAFTAARLQMTLLDDAGLANIAGRLITQSYTIPLSRSIFTEPFARQRLSDVFSVGWVDPIPDASAWIDNYVSLVGMWHGEAVNVALPMGMIYGVDLYPFNWPSEVHGYACDWYAESALHLNGTLGNRYSFERLGDNAQFPTPEPFAVGSLYSQVPVLANDYSLVLETDIDDYVKTRVAELVQTGLLKAANTLAGVGQKVGDVVVNVVENAIPDGLLEWGGVSSVPVFSLRATLTTTGAAPRPGSRGEVMAADGGVTEPGTWLPLAVPSDAALFAFDFKLAGEGAEDVFSVSIGGTNVFALEARYMPTNETLNSGPIDVTRWAGQNVEFFFGLVGGTSTNATITVEAMRFHQIDPPTLVAELSGDGLVVSWPATFTGFALECSDSLASTNWLAVTNSPTFSGMRQFVTNSFVGAGRFYRLKRN